MIFDSRYFTKFMKFEMFMAVEIPIKFMWFLKRIVVIIDTFERAGYCRAGETV
jgi:hypothetical protein